MVMKHFLSGRSLLKTATCVMYMAFFACRLGPPVAFAEEKLDDLIASWREVQPKVASAKFDLHVRRMLAGAMQTPADRELGLKTAPADITPQTCEFDEAILFRGDNGDLRIDSAQPTLNKGKTGFVPASRTAAFNGKKSRNLRKGAAYPMPIGHEYPKGHAHIDVEDISYKPLFISLRPLSKGFLGDSTLDLYKLATKRQEGPNATAALCLAKDNREIWISDKGHQLKRYVSRLADGSPHAVVEVKKTEQRGNLCIPLEWTATHFGSDGSIQSETDVTVKSYEINPDLGDKEFEVAFPVGALIYCPQDDGPDKQFKIGEDGKWVPVKRVLNSQANAYGNSNSLQPRRYNAWLWANAAVVVVVAGLLVRRKLKH